MDMSTKTQEDLMRNNYEEPSPSFLKIMVTEQFMESDDKLELSSTRKST